MTIRSGKAFVCRAPNNFGIEDRTWNYIPNSQTTLVKTKYVGICNSDYSRLFHGTSHFYPITPGHEIVGVIEESGLDSQFLKNSLVCIFPLLPCKICKKCEEREFNLCSNYSYIGSRQHGALSTYIEVPNSNLRTLPEGLPSALLPMIEPMSVIFHAFDSIRDQGSNLLITGSGFLSYVSLCVAKYLEYDLIKILSASQANSELYKGYFFDEKTDDNLQFDCCIDLSGNFEIMNLVTKILAPKSAIVSLANRRTDTYLDLNAREQIIRKELRYIGSWNSTFSEGIDSWSQAITFIASKPNFHYPVKEVKLEGLPRYLNAVAPNFPRERIHVRFEN